MDNITPDWEKSTWTHVRSRTSERDERITSCASRVNQSCSISSHSVPFSQDLVPSLQSGVQSGRTDCFLFNFPGLSHQVLQFAPIFREDRGIQASHCICSASKQNNHKIPEYTL